MSPAPDSNASSTVLLSSKHAAHESDLLPVPKAVLHPGPNGTGLKGENVWEDAWRISGM